jgi:hypothetical protein
MWPRENARQVIGRGGSAEGRARRGGPAVAVGAWAPAIVGLNLNNKRFGKLL